MHLFAIPLALFLLQGCGSGFSRIAVPEEASTRAQVPGIPNARYWADESPLDHQGWMSQSREALEATYPAIIDTEHHYLALSGGGAKGAYGAGILAGWSEEGSRPEFTMVTGISTGALIAPFAFLGSDYDSQMESFYTGVSTGDILEDIHKLTAIWRESMASSAPLKQLISQVVDQKLLNAIAREHRRGRRLMISTTNLDAGRGVTWDIGRIAASNSPNALDLVREIMLASASIPGIFPPVYIDVEADGNHYQEMHVDGGVSAQVTFYPIDVNWLDIERRLNVQGTPNLYVILNTYLSSPYHEVNSKLMAIGFRSVDSLIRTQGLGDVYRLYLLSRIDQLGFNLTYIPQDLDLDAQSEWEFDQEFMKRLFEIGRSRGRDGTAWVSSPPGLERLSSQSADPE